MTVIKKRGDLMDGILWAAGLAENQNEPEVISDYPETVLETLRLFNKLWMLPSNAIPPKKIRGRYEQWIKELDELNSIAGNNKIMSEALPLAYQKWIDMGKKRFIISHPLATRSILIDVVGEMRRNKRDSQVEEQKTEDTSNASPLASKEHMLKAIKDLKSMFKDDE